MVMKMPKSFGDLTNLVNQTGVMDKMKNMLGGVGGLKPEDLANMTGDAIGTRLQEILQLVAQLDETEAQQAKRFSDLKTKVNEVCIAFAAIKKTEADQKAATAGATTPTAAATPVAPAASVTPPAASATTQASEQKKDEKP